LSGAYSPQADEKCKPMPVNMVATVITEQTSFIRKLAMPSMVIAMMTMLM
jgi:hypothetical protein